MTRKRPSAADVVTSTGGAPARVPPPAGPKPRCRPAPDGPVRFRYRVAVADTARWVELLATGAVVPAAQQTEMETGETVAPNVTYGLGLFRVRGGRVSRFTIADGLFNNTVFSMATARDGTLWIGSFGGVAKIRPS